MHFLAYITVRFSAVMKYISEGGSQNVPNGTKLAS
jgi:hypothetical protein